MIDGCGIYFRFRCLPSQLRGLYSVGESVNVGEPAGAFYSTVSVRRHMGKNFTLPRPSFSLSLFLSLSLSLFLRCIILFYNGYIQLEKFPRGGELSRAESKLHGKLLG